MQYDIIGLLAAKMAFEFCENGEKDTDCWKNITENFHIAEGVVLKFSKH